MNYTVKIILSKGNTIKYPTRLIHDMRNPIRAHIPPLQSLWVRYPQLSPVYYTITVGGSRPRLMNLFQFLVMDSLGN